ncbi:MAG: nucleotidyltransferase family protein [Armatimonadota bacterium]|nr:nucleotidyltransferase family protein [Armatimonadota bacterium]MDR7561063.1 nucleotidyltransferase family protein [Armatimonadota bacterium]
MSDAVPVAAVVLAAGSSRRMGRPKLLLTYRGRPLLVRVVEAAWEGGCDPVVVVLGADADRYRPVLEGTPAAVVENPDHAEGMSTSIRAGIQALPEDTRAVVILLADQPFIDAGTVRRLREVYQTTQSKIVACRYGDVVGVPVLFDRALFLELLVLDGDQGARQVLRTYPRHVVTVEIPPEAARDIDTPDDAALLE